MANAPRADEAAVYRLYGQNAQDAHFSC